MTVMSEPAARQEFLRRLEVDYSALPVAVILAAVERYRHVTAVRGDDPSTRVVVEMAVRHRLAALLAAQEYRAEGLAGMGVASSSVGD